MLKQTGGIESDSRAQNGWDSREAPDDWSILLAGHPNVLLIGSPMKLEAALTRLVPHLRAPLVHWHAQSRADPPRTSTGTLVLWDVDTLDRAGQQHLLSWMENHRGATQVVSIAQRSLFSLVTRDAFLDTLYYRLNVLCLMVDPGQDLALDAQTSDASSSA